MKAPAMHTVPSIVVGSLLVLTVACGTVTGGSDEDATAVDATGADATDTDGGAPDALPENGQLDGAAPPNVTDGMVEIAGGPFKMGCNQQADPRCARLVDENPYHDLTIDSFWIDRTEVSQRDYFACIEAGRCNTPQGIASDSRLPVINVAWAEALTYCQWRGKRLPTEAEWEKAARGTDGRRFPWGNTAPTCNLVRDQSCLPAVAQPVDSAPAGASPYGVLNMAGNVAEWCADWHDETYYQRSPATNPAGPDEPNDTFGADKVTRGGSFLDVGNDYHRASARSPASPLTRNTFVGFRCAYR